MKKEEAEKVKELYTTHWLIDEFNKEIDAMVDPVPARPKTGDTVRIKSIQEIAKTGRKFLHGRPEDWTKSMDCTCGKIGKIIDISIMLPDYRAVEFDDGEIWRYNLLDFDPVPEPERPPQKVKVGELFISSNNRILKCASVEWNKDHWVYVSDNCHAFYWDNEITPIIHLQLADEKRESFEVQDLVEWDEQGNVLNGIVVDVMGGSWRIAVYSYPHNGVRMVEKARLCFAKGGSDETNI